MISFVTLLLGLTSGAHEVTVAPGPRVAAVELRLDGAEVAELAAPPWSVRVDFGDGPLPHRLEAVARDAEGGELDRATQWVNLPRPPAEVEISLGAAPGADRVARLAWESLESAEPTAIAVTFDGIPVDRPEGSDGRVWPLPRHDSEGLHFLQARVEFASSLVASGELLFGGGMRDETSALATAVPVLPAGRRPLRLPELERRLEADGVPLRPLALEGGPLEIVIVVDPSARRALAEMGVDKQRSIAQLDSPVDFRPAIAPPSVDARIPWRARLAWPSASRSQGAQRSYDLFPLSQSFTPEDGELWALLTSVRPPPLAGETRLAEAVAIAGLTAAEGNRRRAVVLVLGEEPRDAGPLSPQAAREFLFALRVPLHVWSFAPTAAPAGWGTVTAIASPPKLERLASRLLRETDRQQLVWVEGLHLPQSIRAAGAGDRFELAGAAR